MQLQTTWNKKATDDTFCDWWSSPGAAINAMLCKDGGVAEVSPPRRSQAIVHEAEAAVRMIPAFHIRARHIRPGQGMSGEPPMAGGNAEVTGRGGLRLGRSVRGEHRCDEGERQPLPSSFIQQFLQTVWKGMSGEVSRQAAVQTLRWRRGGPGRGQPSPR